MDSIRVNRSELVGKSQSKTAVLESLVRANTLNLTGNLDYNKYGKLDAVGFEKVSPLLYFPLAGSFLLLHEKEELSCLGLALPLYEVNHTLTLILQMLLQNDLY